MLNSPKSNLTKKTKLTGEGKKILAILQTEYGMDKENAVKLMVECGPLLVCAILKRRNWN